MEQIKTLPVFASSDLSEEMMKQIEDQEIIKKIEKYIKNTKTAKNKRYDMSLNEAVAVYRQEPQIYGITLAFEYGRAKGYRAAQNERKKA